MFRHCRIERNVRAALAGCTEPNKTESFSNGCSTFKVTKSEAEMTHEIAAAKIDRASQLPGVSLSRTVGKNSNFCVKAGGAQFGLGTGARFKAIKIAKETAGRRVSQANEGSNRALLKLQARLPPRVRNHKSNGPSQEQP